MLPMISIICPTYNEEKYINECILSILESDFPHQDMEVLFIDGMSSDSTREIILKYTAKHSFIKLIDNHEKFVPFALNKGIIAAKGDIIIRIDAHAKYEKNYFSLLVKYLNQLNADNVGGICNTLPVNDSLVAKAIASVLNSSFGVGNSYFRIGAKDIKKVDTVPFGCFRKEIFKNYGMFDEELIRNQDDELNARIIRNGGTIYLIPEIKITYFSRDTINKVKQMFYQYGLFKPLVNKKIGKPATIRQFFPLFFVLGLMIGFPLSIFFESIRIIYIITLCFYIILSIFFSTKDSKNIKQIFIQSWIFLIIHLSYGYGYLRGILNLIFKQNFSVNTNR